MIRTKAGLFTVLVALLSFNTLRAELNVTKVVDLESGQDLILVESDSTNELVTFEKLTNENGQFTIYKSEKHGYNAPLVVTSVKKVQKEGKNKAAQNCLLGTGGCLLGIAFVSANGEKIDDNNPPQGLYAQVGDKAVSGGEACLPASLWIGGLYAGIKGIVQLIQGGSKKSTASNQTIDSSQMTKLTSTDLMQSNRLRSEENYNIDVRNLNAEQLNSWLVAIL